MPRIFWRVLQARSLYRMLRSPLSPTTLAFLLLSWLAKRQQRS